ncbi:carbohydrate esterase family 4 protein [Truncatella angustata]|uniref:Carbohydrate esterase family 4 protein n=1 Tax=Truncatella angustata TaxID=152316 RepID=A0A9P8RLB1_9PEZI|nr:carbohydrate esterase family 4 protein [Truncatella angustata]KAH6645405.1 carbohydrate esterase family 4 protein [Truncatella angustata]
MFAHHHRPASTALLNQGRNGPSGPDIDVDRSHVGAVPYGKWIYNCTNPGEVALTFDDGPMDYTQSIVDSLDSAGFRGTFFVVGFYGYRKIYDETTTYPSLLRSMHERGHQIGSHTWRHFNLDRLSSEERIDEIVNNEKAFAKVLGFVPTYLRPPFGSCKGPCLEDLRGLGYHAVYWDIDTKDYLYDTEETYHFGLDRFTDDLNAGGSLALCHDKIMHTATKLVHHMIWELQRRGLKGVTIGECLGDPEANWYREASWQ